MNKPTALLLVATALLTITKVQAQTNFFWDVNGSTNGFGTNPRNGTWGVDSFWTTNSSGTSPTVAWPGNARPTAPDNARFDGGNGTVTVSGSQTVGTVRASAAANFTLTNGTIQLETGNFGTGLTAGSLFTGEQSSTLVVNSDVVLAADGGSGTREIFFSAGRLDAAASFLTINGNVSGGISGRSQTIIVDPRNDTSTTSIIAFGSGSVVANGTSTLLNMEYGARQVAANSGRIVLNSGSHTYTGESRIGSGTIVVNADAPSGSAGALGSTTNALNFGYGNTPAAGTNRLLIGTAGVTIGRNININNGAGSSNTYGVVLGGEHTNDSSTFSGNIALGNQTRATAVQLTSAAGATVNFTGNLRDGATNSVVPIVKIGEGTVTLGGSNTYKGGTTVSAGTLIISGSVTGPGSFAVDAGATVSGTGSIGGAATVAGTIAPGEVSTNGLLTLTDTLAVAGNAQFRVFGNNINDKLLTSGGATFSGTVSVLIDAGYTNIQSGDAFDLVDGSIAGTPSLSLPALPGGLVWETNAFLTTGQLSITNGGPVNDYDAWAAYWTNAEPGFTNTAGVDDPDGDAFVNNVEFAFDGNPAVGSPAFLTAAKSGTNAVFRFIARNSGVTYTVRGTTNLALGGWTNASVTVTNSADTNNINIPADYTRKEFTVPASASEFYKVEAVFTP